MYDPTKPYIADIKRLIRQTWETPYVSVRDTLYPLTRRKQTHSNREEVDHIDGIGTKGFYHWQKENLGPAALDALAMNLNDLALVRARPYKLTDKIIVPQEDVQGILDIIKTLVTECTKRRIAIVGGETAIMDTLNGVEISINASGFVTNPKENRCRNGDMLIGIQSSGLQSNGFSLVRELFGNEVRPEWTVPTEIYSDIILALDQQHEINGMMHITGGAYTKIKQVLGDNNAYLTNSHSLKPHPIFQTIYEQGIADEKMYTTFNCGIGFILSASPEEVEKIIYQLHYHGFNADIIGDVTSGNGTVAIKSMFSNALVEL